MSEPNATKITSAKIGSFEDTGVVDDERKLTCSCFKERDLRSRFTDLEYTLMVLFCEQLIDC